MLITWLLNRKYNYNTINILNAIYVHNLVTVEYCVIVKKIMN